MRALLLGIVFVASLGSFARADVADPFPLPKSPEARAHLVRGNKLYGLRRFREAIDEYQAGALVEAAAIFDYDLGQANRQLQNYREAIWYYEQYLNHWSPTGRVRDAVVAFIAEMKVHLENKAQKMPPTEPAPEPLPRDGNGPSRSQSATVDASGARSAHAPERGRDWVGWSLAGTGAIGAGVSGYLFYSASQFDDQASSAAQTQERRAQLTSDAHGRRVAGAITTGCSVALIVAGIVKLALRDDEPRGASSWNVAPTHNGVVVLARF